MYLKLVVCFCLILFSPAVVAAQDTAATAATTATTATTAKEAGDSDAKTLRGMSVLGNKEAPMSLFIVPWKSSQLGAGANVQRTLTEHDVPVDRDVFIRELNFYQVSVAGRTAVPAAGSRVLTLR